MINSILDAVTAHLCPDNASSCKERKLNRRFPFKERVTSFPASGSDLIKELTILFRVLLVRNGGEHHAMNVGLINNTLKLVRMVYLNSAWQFHQVQLGNRQNVYFDHTRLEFAGAVMLRIGRIPLEFL